MTTQRAGAAARPGRTRSRPGESAYRTVGRELRTQVLEGAFADGRRLPTEAELSRDYGVSRQTVRRAFHDLVADDLVYRIPGRGTFARPPNDGYVRQVGSIDDLLGLSDDTALRLVEPLTRRVDPASAGRLRLPSDAVFRLRFLRVHAGTVFCVTTVFLPPHLAASLTDVDALTTPGATSTLTVIGLLERRHPGTIAVAEQSITVDLADQQTAPALDRDPGEPLLRVDRLYLDARGRGVELAVSHFLPEHYSYRISLRRRV